MAAKITRDVLESYLHCKTKGYLKLTGQQGTKCDYEVLMAEMRAEVRLAVIDRIVAKHPGDEVARNIPLTPAALKKGPLFVLDGTLEDESFSLVFDGLKRVEGASKLGDFHYVPMIFYEGEKVGKEKRLLLKIYGLLLSRLQGQMPEYGILFQSKECKTTRVRLNADLRKTERFLHDVKEICSAETPPKLMLNDHCQVCQFRQPCHDQAVQVDSLSLLRGMGEKEIKKCNRKGIFTVTQFSYTFRPKKHRKRTAPQTLKHSYALQARAIRDNSIYLVQRPQLPSTCTSVYLDVEGDSENTFYYLIGLYISDGKSCKHYSFWADKKEEEQIIWIAFLKVLGKLSDFTVYHYGSYELRFFRKMNRLYGGDADLITTIASRMFNVLSITYNQIYFPVYSNALKAIATWLKFQWSDSNASGLQCLVWHYNWRKDRDNKIKEQIIRYNQDDCLALTTLVDTIRSICGNNSSGSLTDSPRVVGVDDTKQDLPYVFGRKHYCSPDLEFVRKHSFFEYQRNRIYLRDKKKSGSRPNFQPQRSPKRLQISKCLELADSPNCPECGSEEMRKVTRRKRDVIDLRFSSKGVKSWVVRYVARQYRCQDCGSVIMPEDYLALGKFRGRTKCGRNLCMWCVYCKVALRQSIDSVVQQLRDLFQINLHRGFVSESILSAAQEYEATRTLILEKLRSGFLVHADETWVPIKGLPSGKGYVSTFATMEEVLYVYSDTRDGSVAEEILKGFHGTLVTDFYAGYDSIKCDQQKCLLHLIRDINDDVFKFPGEGELLHFAEALGVLLRPIIETIDRYGLRKLHLNKHLKDVDRFYAHEIERCVDSELVSGYQKRMIKFRDRLFVFLQKDGVPWNNNNGENAIKAFVTRRKSIGATFSREGIKAYLVMLSIFQTLRYRNRSFLRFLLSKEIDIDVFCKA